MHSKWKPDLDSYFLQPTVLVWPQDPYTFHFRMIKSTAKYICFYDYIMQSILISATLY